MKKFEEMTQKEKLVHNEKVWIEAVNNFIKEHEELLDDNILIKVVLEGNVEKRKEFINSLNNGEYDNVLKGGE